MEEIDMAEREADYLFKFILKRCKKTKDKNECLLAVHQATVGLEEPVADCESIAKHLTKKIEEILPPHL